MARQPHLVLDPRELQDVVRRFRQGRDSYVLDVETTVEPAGPRANKLLWIGLASSGETVLIPVDHPMDKGKLLIPAAKVNMLVGAEDRKRSDKTDRLLKTRKQVSLDPVYGPAPQQIRPDVACEILEPLLFSEDHAVIGHNVKFDIETLAKYYDGRLMPGPYHDTIVLQHVLDEDQISYELKELLPGWAWGRELTPAIKKRHFPKLGTKIAQHGLYEVAPYLSKDVYLEWLYFNDLAWRARKAGLWDLYQWEMSTYGVVMAMEQKGVRIQTEALAAEGVALEASIKELTAKAWEANHSIRFDLTNFAQKREIFFGKRGAEVTHNGHLVGISRGLEPVSRTKKTNQIQLTREVLEVLAEEDGDELALLLVEHSKLEKLHGTYIVGLQEMLYPDARGVRRLHTGYKYHGTTTGRYSSAQPNLQNLPRKGFIRTAFIPDEGCVLIVADYGQIEMRGAAYLSKDPGLCKVLIDGIDVHRASASAAYGIPVESVTEDQRFVGKTFGFAVLYGATARRLAHTAGIPEKEAERLLDAFYTTYSGLLRWKAEVLRTAKRNGNRESPHHQPPYVEIPPFGRRRRLPDLFLDPRQNRDFKYAVLRAERQAINAVVQGFASYIMKMAMKEMHQRIVDEGLPYDILLTVHDELVVQAPQGVAEECRKFVEEVMVGVSLNGVPILGDIPLVVDAHMGMSWAEAKGA